MFCASLCYSLLVSQSRTKTYYNSHQTNTQARPAPGKTTPLTSTLNQSQYIFHLQSSPPSPVAVARRVSKLPPGTICTVPILCRLALLHTPKRYLSQACRALDFSVSAAAIRYPQHLKILNSPPPTPLHYCTCASLYYTITIDASLQNHSHPLNPAPPNTHTQTSLHSLVALVFVS